MCRRGKVVAEWSIARLAEAGLLGSVVEESVRRA